MIVKDLGPLLVGPLTINRDANAMEFDNFVEIPAQWLDNVVLKMRAQAGRLVMEVRDPHSTEVLETHGYQFEAGF